MPLFNEDDFNEHTFTVSAHLSFLDEEQRKNARSMFEDSQKEIEFLGRLAHVNVPEWPETIRLDIDRSLFFPHGLFMTWISKFRGSVDLNALDRGAQAIVTSASRFDLKIAVP